MKIWLDDIRTPPDDTWEWAKSYSDFANLWVYNTDEIEAISFDHDIASFDAVGNELTGYHCLCIVEKYWRYHDDFVLPELSIHTSNPVGRKRMALVIGRMQTG